MLIFIIGIILSFILHFWFLKSGSKADIFDWWIIIMFYLVLFLINIASEIGFYLLLNKNIHKAYWYSILLIFLFILQGFLRSSDKLNYQYIFYTPIFFALSLGIYFIDKKI